MKFFLIAGERSGDMHGSNLIGELKLIKPGARFRGLGGEQMESRGMELVAHYSAFNLMGFLEVLIHYSRIKKYLDLARTSILDYKPDALILIDFGGFNMRIAKFARENGIRVVYYIPPKVWAWNTGRARKLKRDVDQLLSILPFEVDFYRQLGWDIDYVGNPVNDAVRKFLTGSPGRIETPVDKKVVALLPGSRKQELLRVLPLLWELVDKRKDLHFLMAGVDNLKGKLYERFIDRDNVDVVFNMTYEVLLSSHAAVVTSGTATLETALLNIPQVVVYKAGTLSYQIAKQVIKVDHISLVNLILGRELVREYIQAEADLPGTEAELESLLSDSTYREHIFSGYRELSQMLGDTPASLNAARKIIEELESRS